MMGLAGLLGTVELKSRWSGRLWLFVPPETARPNIRGSLHRSISFMAAIRAHDLGAPH